MVTMTPQATTAPPAAYPGPPPSYSYATTTSMSASVPNTATTHTSPAASHFHDEKDLQQHSAPIRQSLPSLSEALAQDRPAYSYERTPQSVPNPYRRSASPRSPKPGGYAEQYRRRDDDVRWSDQRSSTSQAESSHFGKPYSQVAYGPVNNSTNPPSPARPLYAQGAMPPPAGQRPSYGRSPKSPSFAPHSYRYAEPPQQRQYSQPAASTPYITSYPAISVSTVNGNQEPPWPSRDRDDLSSGKHTNSSGYAESVKRQLDNFDLEASLNEVCESSHNVMQFGEAFRLRVHQTHRSGNSGLSQPSIEEVQEALRYSSQTHEALSKILDRLQTEEAECLERSAKELLDKQQASAQLEDSAASGQNENGSFVGADVKKRRGVSFDVVDVMCYRMLIVTQRAAPPGRCHSCNRAETPEWRRGPDGARTLCNACGLRKSQINQFHGGSPSNHLRLRQVDSQDGRKQGGFGCFQPASEAPQPRMNSVEIVPAIVFGSHGKVFCC